MKKRLAISALLISAGVIAVTGCSTNRPKYHLIMGGRADSYSETQAVPLDRSLANMLGGTVTTSEGDPNKISSIGYGGQAGIVEENKNIVTTIALFYSKYLPVSYSFYSSKYGKIGETLNVQGYGVDATIGYKLWIFRPGISYKYEAQKMSAVVSGSGIPPTTVRSSSTVFMIGGGLGIDIPFSLRAIACSGRLTSVR